jgi:hypothetical protein
MSLTFTGLKTFPTYLALSSDILDNATIPNASLVGRVVLLTDTGAYKLILPNLKLIPFSFANGTSGVAPAYVSSEIGTVNATTLVLTLSENVVATNYASGFTIKVAGVSRTISSATRQATHSIIRFVLGSAVTTGQTVTIEYNSSSGGIISQTGSVYMADVSAQTATNNV